MNREQGTGVCPGGAKIADYFPPHKLARAIGVYTMGLYGGAGLALLAGSAVVALVSGAGPVTLPVIGEWRPWQLTFFIVALPGVLVLAPTIIQLIAPNRVRAQVTAIFILIAVLTGYTGGPTLAAMLNDYVFRDENALDYSLAIVSGVLTPIGVILLIRGRKPYREPRTAAAESDAADDGRR